MGIFNWIFRRPQTKSMSSSGESASGPVDGNQSLTARTLESMLTTLVNRAARGATMEAKVYKLRGGTKFGFIFITVVAALFAAMGVGVMFTSAPGTGWLGLIFLLPGLIVAVWSFSAIVRGQLVLDQHQILATCFVTKRIRLTDIARLGLYRATALGFAQEMALGGGEGTILWIMDKAGHTSKVDVFRFGGSDDFLRLLKEQVQLEYETVTSGWWSASWSS
jgi:hypothetical protein